MKKLQVESQKHNTSPEMKHFTLIEIGGDSDFQMIGTIPNVLNNKQGIKSFKERFLIAVSEHFDFENFNHDAVPDLFCGSPFEDLMIEADGLNHELRIFETWLY